MAYCFIKKFIDQGINRFKLGDASQKKKLTGTPVCAVIELLDTAILYFNIICTPCYILLVTVVSLFVVCRSGLLVHAIGQWV